MARSRPACEGDAAELSCALRTGDKDGGNPVIGTYVIDLEQSAILHVEGVVAAAKRFGLGAPEKSALSEHAKQVLAGLIKAREVFDQLRLTISSSEVVVVTSAGKLSYRISRKLDAGDKSTLYLSSSETGDETWIVYFRPPYLMIDSESSLSEYVYRIV